MKPKKKRAKSSLIGSPSQRPRGRPATRVIEQIDATPDAIVKAVFRVADRERDARIKKGQ